MGQPIRCWRLLTTTLVSLLLLGCGQRPQITVTTSLLDDQIVFSFSHSQINGIIGFRVKDEADNLLWSVKNPDDQGITYGRLPGNGGYAKPTQLFPLDNTSPVSIRGTTVTVFIDYQYDNLAPSTGTYRKTIAIP